MVELPLHRRHEVRRDGIVAVDPCRDEEGLVGDRLDEWSEGVPPEGLVRPHRGEHTLGQGLDVGPEALGAPVVEEDQPLELRVELLADGGVAGVVEERQAVPQPLLGRRFEVVTEDSAEPGEEEVVEVSHRTPTVLRQSEQAYPYRGGHGRRGRSIHGTSLDRRSAAMPTPASRRWPDA